MSENSPKSAGNQGGFTINNPILAPYIDKIEGDEDSIIGLPMRLVEKLINKVK